MEFTPEVLAVVKEVQAIVEAPSGRSLSVKELFAESARREQQIVEVLAARVPAMPVDVARKAAHDLLFPCVF